MLAGLDVTEPSVTRNGRPFLVLASGCLTVINRVLCLQPEIMFYVLLYLQLVACAASDSSTGAAAATSAHTTTLANPNSSDFAWQRGYSWYPDTPGQYPASKWDYYYSSGGLYDQAHTSSHAGKRFLQVILNHPYFSKETVYYNGCNTTENFPTYQIQLRILHHIKDM